MWEFLSTLIKSISRLLQKKKVDRVVIEKAISSHNFVDPAKGIWSYFEDSVGNRGLCSQAAHNQVMLSPTYGSVTQFSKHVVCISTGSCKHFFSPGVSIVDQVVFGQAFMQIVSDRPGLQLIYWTTDATCSLRSCLGKHLFTIITDHCDQDDTLKLRYAIDHPSDVRWRQCYVDNQ